MCGIATISIGRRCRGRIPYPTLRRLVTEILNGLEDRGMEASGIAVINEQKPGVDSVVFKKPLRPSRLIVRPKFDAVLQTIDQNTNFILLHSRATTIGDTSNNFNNHPIVIPPIIGIHNGTLFNHEDLFRKYRTAFDQRGEVDSEVIFKLYRHYTDTVGLCPQEALKATSDELQGAYTGAIVDMRERHRMVMFKFERTLHIFFLPHFDMVVAVSEARFYDDACRTLRVKAKDKHHVVKDGTGLIMDLNMPGHLVHSVIDFDIPVERLFSWYGGHSKWVQSVPFYG